MRRALSIKLVAGLAAVGLALTACSSGSSSSGTTSAAATTAESSAAESSAAESSAAESSGAESSPAETSGSAGAASSGAAEPEITGDPASVQLGMAYDIGGRGDTGFNDLAAAAFDKAKAAGVTIAGELSAAPGEPDSAKVDRLNQLIDSGATNILAIGFAYALPLAEVAEANPDVRFAIVDDASLADVPNVTSLTFAEEQGSYLVGVAAALKTETNKVGFIGGVNVPLLQKFQAGFEAGVKATNPEATVTVKYLTEPPDFTGFNSPQLGETNATGMYADGNDIIYTAAAGSNSGVFKAAQASGNLAIGVDADQYLVPALADVKDVIMTSMLKKVDVATYAWVVNAINGTPLDGVQVYDLSNNGVGYSTSGGKIDDIVAQLDEAAAGIVDGSITVPATPGG